MRRPRRKLPQSKRQFYKSKVPRFLADARAKVRQFVDNPRIFPELALRPGHIKTTYLPFRYALAQALCVLISCMELCSMRIGYPVGNRENRRFRSRTNEQLIKRAKLGLRRWQRAMAVLKASFADFARVYARAEAKADGTFIGHAAVRVLTEWLFHRLHMHPELEIARQEAAEDQRADVALIREGRDQPSAERARSRTGGRHGRGTPPAPDTS